MPYDYILEVILEFLADDEATEIVYHSRHDITIWYGNDPLNRYFERGLWRMSNGPGLCLAGN